MKSKLGVAILGWGGYVPIYRIKVEDISRQWREDPSKWERALFLREKSVPGLDEDSTTLAVEAARFAINRAKIDPKSISALYVGTESKAYAVKPTSTIVAAAVGAPREIVSADLEFACKAGTEALNVCLNHVLVRRGVAVAIGTDTAQGSPRDPLEYSAGAGAAALVLGKASSPRETAAIIEHHFSYVSDTPDFWRCNGEKYPKHGERFTGMPAYFKHSISAAKGLMGAIGTVPQDYSHVIFHQPNGKFPLQLAKMLGFEKSQLKHGFLVDKIGNTYAANTLLGLAAVLDKANPGEKVLLVSYGSGAGSDAYHIEVKDGVLDKRFLAPLLSEMLDHKVYLSYGEYAWHREMIVT